MARAETVPRNNSQSVFAHMATALAFVSVGALAIGALAIGRLVIKRVAVEGATFKRVRSGELEVDRLRIRGRIAE